MNFSSLKEYLSNGLDPAAEDMVNAPFMRTLHNWIPSQTGIKSASKLSLALGLTTLTGYAPTPFGLVTSASPMPWSLMRLTETANQ